MRNALTSGREMLAVMCRVKNRLAYVHGDTPNSPMNEQLSSDSVAQIKRHEVSLGTGRLSVLYAGPDGGASIILIHGLGWDAARLWSAQMQRLAVAGWRVLAPDLRGNGRSSSIRAELRVPDLAEDVAAMLETLAIERPVLVGFSMGGMVAADLALRPGTDPAGLVIACGGVTCPPEAEAATNAMLAKAAELGPEAFARAQAQAIFAPEWAARNPQAVAEFQIWRAQMDQESLRHSFRAPFGCDYAPRLGAIECPSAVFAAAEDSFVDLNDARALAARLPDAQFEVIPDTGHMAPIEAPEAFDDALSRFLLRVALRPEPRA